jgi:23S rRNA pseudouridine1911/1915/1917 synthase
LKTCPIYGIINSNNYEHGDNKMDNIIYEDKSIIVCIKPCGVLSQKDSSQKKSMPDILEKDVFCVHRLDREVSGIMVYAKNKKSASFLSSQIQNGDFEKEYIAVVHGNISEKNAVFEDLLFKDSSKNKTFVVKKERKGVKSAKLEYTLLENKNNFSLVKIKLYTGRTHQIRVQFSSRNMPLFADRKYGGRDEGKIGLFSHQISFISPEDKSRKIFRAYPENEMPWSMFESIKEDK